MEKQLNKLKRKHKSWAVVADEIGVSTRQLQRYRDGENIPIPVRKLIIRLIAEA